MKDLGTIARIGGGMMIVRPGAAPEKPGVHANVRLPGEEAREVPSFDLSSR